METFNYEAFLWSVTLVLWAVLFYMWSLNRRYEREQDSIYPHVNGIGSGTERVLRQAGLSGDIVGKAQYWAAKLFCVLLFVIAVLIVHAIRGENAKVSLLIIPVLIGFIIPDLFLYQARIRRMRQIRASLSFFLDLVVALLRAGLPIHRALFKAARDGFVDPHPLSDEVLRVEGEIQVGKDRGTAFYALADRTGVQELRTLAAAVHVSLTQGASIEDTLEIQAEVLRERRREEAIRRMNSATSFSILPVFLCGIPIFAVVVYFPAFLEIIETLSSLRIF